MNENPTLESSLTADEFRIFVEQVSILKPETIFKNGSKSNANIVIANIFNTSKEVKLFVDTLDGQIHEAEEDYLKALNLFLKKDNSQLKVIFQGDPAWGSRACNIMKEHPNKVSFKKLSDPEAKNELNKFIVSNYGQDYTLKFSIGDKDKFRLQALPKKSEKFSAFFSFNNKDVTNKLDIFFNEIWQKSTAVPVLA
jgi:hypothetical protein